MKYIRFTSTLPFLAVFIDFSSLFPTSLQAASMDIPQTADGTDTLLWLSITGLSLIAIKLATSQRKKGTPKNISGRKKTIPPKPKKYKRPR